MIADILLKVAGQFQDEEHDYFPRCSLAGPERCLRQMVFWGLKVERESLPGRTLHVFDDGHWHAELTLDWLRKTAYSVHSEEMELQVVAPIINPQEPTPMPILPGHIDGIVTDIMGKDYLLELKSSNHFSFMRWWNKEELPLDYMTQCCLYLRGLNVINPSLREGILLIKNKNTSAYLEYLFEYDYRADAVFIVNKINSNGEKVDIKESIEHITANAFVKFATVQEHIDKKTLPLRQYERDHWRCEYCGWGEVCWKGWEKEFGELKTDLVFPAEFADTVRFYNELGAQASEADKHRKEIKVQVLRLLREAGAKEGRAGEYIVQLLLQHKKGFTVDPSTTEKLQVTKVKEG